MFTGIIEHVGTVTALARAARRDPDGSAAFPLAVDVGPLSEQLPLGASVAVNGVCLTVARLAGTVANFDVVPETWQRTTLRELQVGGRVNLERSLRVGDRLDGHFVQGHVDAVGTVERIDRGGGEWKLRLRAEQEVFRNVVPKGSIAIDGTSLTVVDVTPPLLSVALVPTTLENTVLKERGPAARVNIETDMLVRAVMSRLGVGESGAAPAGVNLASLAERGFL